jgi:hypothetical protein
MFQEVQFESQFILSSSCLPVPVASESGSPRAGPAVGDASCKSSNTAWAGGVDSDTPPGDKESGQELEAASLWTVFVRVTLSSIQSKLPAVKR